MYKTVDLFAGAGGLSYGFEMTGKFLVVAAAENNRNAQKTYKANHLNPKLDMIDDVRKCDFKKLAEKFDGIDVIIGGPPCQGFSNANRQKNHIVSMNNSLVKEYFRAVKEIKPKAFIMENVAMLASKTHKFYDSQKDHDEVVSLGIEMKQDELVLSDEMYKEFDLLTIINENDESAYQVSDELFQLLNVLYKNRKNQEKLEKYIKKNAKVLIKEIEEFLNEDTCSFDILTVIKDSICNGLSMGWFEELGRFLKFQKSFKLKKELDDNEILYELTRNPITGKISAFVNSYTVYEYVNKILGDKYIKNSGVVNSLWFGVPQERRRFIMIGINKDFIKEPSIDMPVDQNLPIITVGEAIMDLMPYQTSDTVTEEDVQEYKESGNISEYAKLMRLGSVGVKNHIVPKTREKSLERFVALQEGENFHKLSTELKDNYADPSRTQNSIYLRLDSTKPSGTVINVRKSMWIHPQLNRAISVREAARLQSFPDKFIFKGPKDAQYQQIGNAVPPLMAKGIAEHLLKYI
ncbi:MAG: DNA cytosine methyltransferase [Desulfovibrionaceae bacterium]|nr:MAG: DNA cytosine methyltransferase [Desulfovibrionaceae bacterium]